MVNQIRNAEYYKQLNDKDTPTVGGAGPVLKGAFVGAAIVIGLVGTASSHSETHDAKQFSEDVQVYNPQIQEQLAPSYSDISKLVLKDNDGKTFSFRAVNKAGEAETCHGHYAVKKDMAQVAGSIACTVTAELGE